MAAPLHPLTIPGHRVAAPRHPLIIPRHLVAAPRHPLTIPRHQAGLSDEDDDQGEPMTDEEKMEVLPDLHATCAGLKAFSTWATYYGIDTLRQVSTPPSQCRVTAPRHRLTFLWHRLTAHRHRPLPPLDTLWPSLGTA